MARQESQQVWKNLYAPDYSSLGAAAHRALASKACRLHPLRRWRGCRRCQYVLEMHRQAAARALARYWERWEAEHQAKWRTAAAVALDRYWQARADAARALEIYWEHRREG